MEFVLAIVIGVLYAVGLYLIMRRSLVKLILGIALLGYGANLLIFTIGRITREAPPHHRRRHQGVDRTVC